MLFIFVFFTLFLSSHSQACPWVTFSNVYRTSMTDLADGGFLLLILYRDSTSVTALTMDKDGLVTNTRTLYDNANPNDAFFSVRGLPDGNITLCYKSSSSTYAYVENRDPEFNILWGPIQASTNLNTRCHKSTVVAQNHIVHNFESGTYITFDYYINGALFDSNPTFALTSSKPIVRASKFGIVYTKVGNSIYRAPLGSYSASGFTASSFTSWSSQNFDIHNYRVSGVEHTMLIYKSNSNANIWINRLSETYAYAYDTQIFGQAQHASAIHPGRGRGFVCAYISPSIFCNLFTVSTGSAAGTQITISQPEAIVNMTLISLSTGRYVLQAFGSTSNKYYYMLIGSQGSCSGGLQTDYTCGTGCTSPCLNLAGFDYCSYDVSVVYQYFEANKPVLNVTLTAPSETYVFSDKSLTYSLNLIESSPASPVSYGWICSQTVDNTTYSPCNASLASFFAGNSDSTSLVLKFGDYMSQAGPGLLTFKIKGNVSNPSKTTILEATITVIHKSKYFQDLCTGSTRPECISCMYSKSCALPDNTCIGFLASCYSCSSDDDCPISAPCCASGSCVATSLSATLQPNSTAVIIFEDQVANLTGEILSLSPSFLTPNFTFTCSGMWTEVNNSGTWAYSSSCSNAILSPTDYLSYKKNLLRVSFNSAIATFSDQNRTFVFQYTLYVNTSYNNVTLYKNVTVHIRQKFYQGICMNSTRPDCYTCMTNYNCLAPNSLCLGYRTGCFYCSSSSQCPMSTPACYLSECYSTSLKGTMQSVNSNYSFFDDQTVNMSIAITNKFPYDAAVNYAWNCSAMWIEANNTNIFSTMSYCSGVTIQNIFTAPYINNVSNIAFTNAITNYPDSNRTYIFRISAFINTTYDNTTLNRTITVISRQKYYQGICTGSTRSSCLACMMSKNCSFPDTSCYAYKSECFYCTVDSQCPSNRPSCYLSECVSPSLLGIIMPDDNSANQVYDDQVYELSLKIATNFPPATPVNFSWTCTQMWLKSQTSTNYESRTGCSFINIAKVSVAPGVGNGIKISFQNNTRNYTDQNKIFIYQFQIYFNSTYENFTFYKNVTVFDRLAFTISPFAYYTPSNNYSLQISSTDANFFTNAKNLAWEILPSMVQYSSSQTDLFSLLKGTNNFYSYLPDNYLRIKLVYSGNLSSITSRNQSLQVLIPINYPPNEGYLMVTPTLGLSLLTNYSIATLGWQDTDLPILYRFTYKYSLPSPSSSCPNYFSEEFLPLTVVESELIGNPNSSYITIKIEAKDSYGAINETSKNITCDIHSYSMAQTVNSIMPPLNLVYQSFFAKGLLDLSCKLAKLDLIAYHLVNAENTTWTNRSEICPSCNGHGTCNKFKECICDSDWTSYDCKIPMIDYNQSIPAKNKVLDSIAMVCALYPDIIKTDDFLLESLKKLSANQDYNSIETMSKIQEILEHCFNVTKTTTMLTNSQAQSVSIILDNIFKFISNYDCGSRTNMTQNILNNTEYYIQTISRSLAKNATIYDNATVLDRDKYSLYIKKMSVCVMNNSVMTSTSKAPVVDLGAFVNITGDVNCSKSAIVQYLSLDSYLMACNGTQNAGYRVFSDVSLNYYDTDTGKKLNIKQVVSLIFNDPKSLLCVYPCTFENLTCTCKDISYLDIKNQMYKILVNSRLKDLLRISDFASKEFWNSFPFYVEMTTLGVALLLIIIFQFDRYKNYDAVKKYVQDTHFKKREESTMVKWLLSYCAAHSLISIIITRESSISKSKKMLIFYIRFILLMTQMSIFGLDPSIYVDSFMSSLTTFNFNLNPYVFLLPYVTAVPLSKFCEQIIAKAFPYNDKKMIQNESYCKEMMKPKKIFATLFTAMVLFASNFSILIITALLDDSMINQWILNVILFQLQEIFVTPFIDIMVTLMLIPSFTSKKMKPYKKTRKFLIKVIMNKSIIMLHHTAFYLSVMSKNAIPMSQPSQSTSDFSNSRAVRKKTKNYQDTLRGHRNPQRVATASTDTSSVASLTMQFAEIYRRNHFDMYRRTRRQRIQIRTSDFTSAHSQASIVMNTETENIVKT